MQILETELGARGYRLTGSVHPDPTPLHFVGPRGYGLFDVDIPDPIKGWVTYIHVLDGEFKKAGKTEKGDSFKARMKGSYNSLRRPIDLMTRGLLVHIDETLYHVDSATGRPSQPYMHDFPWKHRVPLAMIAGRTVHLWGKSHRVRQEMLDEEDALNTHFRGEWAKEGWSTRRSPDRPPVRIRVLAGG